MNFKPNKADYFDAGRTGLFQVPASSEEDIRDPRQPRLLPTLLPWVRLRPASLFSQVAMLPARSEPLRCHDVVALVGDDTP